MSSFFYDLILSGITYVMLTYLCFSLMKRRKRTKDEDDEGGLTIESGPKIDLPPGIMWPDGSGSPIKRVKREEELVY